VKNDFQEEIKLQNFSKKQQEYNQYIENINQLQ